MATLLIGYDVESAAIGEGIARVADHWFDVSLETSTIPVALDIITRNHTSLGVPATLFICGRTLIHALPTFQVAAANSLFDIQQHTYSHVLFKDNAWKGSVFPASPPAALRHELATTSSLLKEQLGVDAIGLRTPHGYYRGLADRPDLVGLVHDVGIRFVSSWGRNEQGENPTPWVQPFWYREQGYPEILEIPFQYWLDANWFEAYGRDRGRDFRGILRQAIDEIVAEDLVYGACFHDWTQVAYRETETAWVRGLIEYALERGVEVLSYRQFYERERDKRSAGVGLTPA
jgi:peptidoglycan/xylan/chitin deacetylase (PgdA/CDA1 family)